MKDHIDPKNNQPNTNSLRILLTNGRFPVALDLARQFKRAGHTVYVLDPMHFHICKFSKSIQRSMRVPAPREDPEGYVNGLRNAVALWRIQLIIPLHEEVFYLAQHDDLKHLLFCMDFHNLLRLHNKWDFSKLMQSLNLDVPETILCENLRDVRNLDRTEEWALKPVFGRACSNMYHLVPGEGIPEELDVSKDYKYVAQRWISGKQICSYAVAQNGELKGCGVYPVIDTIDGSSCVYFEAIDHPGIRNYIEAVVRALNLTGQLAFDFIETENRLVAIECNPRATSGIHLYSNTTWLAELMTNPNAEPRDPLVGTARKLAPGMLMWEHKRGAKVWFEHMKRLVRSKDVIFSWRDIGPTLMQPFLLTSYYDLCRKKKLHLPELFQWDVVWEPTPEELLRGKIDPSLAPASGIEPKCQGIDRVAPNRLEAPNQRQQ